MPAFARTEDRFEISAERISDAASLRSWLAYRWAILFSHPADFTQEEMERDRWISVLSRSFGGHGVVPVAVTQAGRSPEQGWVSQLTAFGRGYSAALALDSSVGPRGDLATTALRALIARCGPRFAAIIDSDLRCRRALTYRLPAELPSPLELIGWAVALRRRDHGA